MQHSLLLLALVLMSCQAAQSSSPNAPQSSSSTPSRSEGASQKLKTSAPTKKERSYKVAHIFVALCDNKYQGIVPTGKAMGDGQNPDTNLYWGAGYGVRSFFNKKRGWKRLDIEQPAYPILERIAVEKTFNNETLVIIADAYDGQYIEDTIQDFLSASAGADPITVQVKDPKDPSRTRDVQAGGFADLVAYIGHNGLMDFEAPAFPARVSTDNPKYAIILACIADDYFREHLAKAGVTPLVWTTNLMGPEAYTIEAALEGWAKNETPYQIRERAAAAYSSYAGCSLGAARKLFASTKDGKGYSLEAPAP